MSFKSKETSVPEAPGVQAIPFSQHSTPVVDLTASSSTSGKQGTEVPISIKPNSPTSVKNPVCPDLIPISSDDAYLVPKSQEGTSTSLAASGFPTRDGSGIISETDGIFRLPQIRLVPLHDGKSRPHFTAVPADIP